MNNTLLSVERLCRDIAAIAFLREKECKIIHGFRASDVPDIEDEFTITISEPVKELYQSINGLNFSWNYIDKELEKNNSYVEGYSRILPFHQMFTGFDGKSWENELWYEKTAEPEKSFLKRLKVLDYFGKDNVQAVCLEISDKSELLPKLWIYRQGLKPIPMEIDVNEYFIKLEATKAIWGWQYLYSTIKLGSPEFASIKANLEFILKYYPLIFKQGFFSELESQFNKLLK